MQGFKTSIYFCDAIICARAHCMCHVCEETDNYAVWHELTLALACLHSVGNGRPVLGQSKSPLGSGGLAWLFKESPGGTECSRVLLQAAKPEIHS